jgi:hypothetical protein
MKKLLKCIGLIVLYFALSVLVSAIIAFLKVKNSFLQNILLSLGGFIVLIVIAYFFKDELKNDWTRFKKNYKEYLKKALKYWLVGFIIMIITNLLIQTLVTGLASNEEANREMLTNYPLYSVIYMCILGPICEELLFRLNFKDIIKGRLPFILITGVLFGSLHVVLSIENITDLFYLIPYSALGIAFGACFYDTDNIYSSIFAHILHNSLSVLVIMLGI